MLCTLRGEILPKEKGTAVNTAHSKARKECLLVEALFPLFQCAHHKATPYLAEMSRKFTDVHLKAKVTNQRRGNTTRDAKQYAS